MNWIKCSDLKREAINSLRGRWGLAIGTFVIGGLITFIPNIISSVMNNITELMDSDAAVLMISIIAIIFSIIVSLLEVITGYGACEFSLNIAENKNAKVKDVFSGFKYTVKLLLVWLIKCVGFSIVLLPLYALIVIIVVYLISSTSAALLNGFGSGVEERALTLMAILIILSIISVIAITILDAFMAQTYYILKENDSESITACIKKSFKMMKGHVWNYIVLNLSFIGWGILCVFTLGIGSLWLYPYTQITRAKFYLKVKEAYYSNYMSISE